MLWAQRSVILFFSLLPSGRMCSKFVVASDTVMSEINFFVFPNRNFSIITSDSSRGGVRRDLWNTGPHSDPQHHTRDTNIYSATPADPSLCDDSHFFDPLRENTRKTSLFSPSGRQCPHCATLAPVETTTATLAVNAWCDASPSGSTQTRRVRSFQVPMWSIRVRHVRPLSPCGLFDSCCGVRHVRCFSSPCGPL